MYPLGLANLVVSQLISGAGGDPWKLDEELQAGDPGAINDLAGAYHQAAGCVDEAESDFVDAKKKFQGAYRRNGAEHPINESAEVTATTTKLRLQYTQIAGIAVDLENIAAALASAQRESDAEIAGTNNLLSEIDDNISVAEAAGQDASSLYQTAIDVVRETLSSENAIRSAYLGTLHSAQAAMLATTGYTAEVLAPLEATDQGGQAGGDGKSVADGATPADYQTHPQSPPLRPGEPIDPKNGRIGDPRFGYWEDVKLPYQPWVGNTPPPLTQENRPFPEDIRNNLAGGPTEFFVPNKSWAFDSEAPYAQLQEQYKIRISGTEATPYTRVLDSAGVPTQQRWVQYNYEVAHVRQVALGGDVKVKGMDEPADIAGLGPFRWRSQDWTPWSFNAIAQLSANNPEIQFHIPDGCGGQFTYQGAVPVGPPPIGVPASPPIMTRPG